MAAIPDGSERRPTSDRRSSTWRTPLVVLVTVLLAGAGLLFLERTAAPAGAAPKAVPAASPRLTATLDAQIVRLSTASAALKGAATLLAQSLPDLDAATAARTADVASSAAQSAALGQRLVAAATSHAAGAAAQANALAGPLQASLAATQSKADALRQQRITGRIKFCNFTIQIGP